MSTTKGTDNMTIVPAYGRDYKSKQEILTALSEGKDFIVSDMFGPDAGRYINVTDMRTAGIKTVQVRYSKQRRVTTIKVPQS